MAYTSYLLKCLNATDLGLIDIFWQIMLLLLESDLMVLTLVQNMERKKIQFYLQKSFWRAKQAANCSQASCAFRTFMLDRHPNKRIFTA